MRLIGLSYKTLYLDIKLPYISKLKLDGIIQRKLIRFNLWIQRYRPSFIFKDLDSFNYCSNCKRVFNPGHKEWVKRIDGRSYCYSCPTHRKSGSKAFTIRYKLGKHEYTEQDYRFATDYTSKHEDYFLQPRRWNNVTRKYEDNPDFTKKYGNAWKDTEVGKYVNPEESEGETPYVEDLTNHGQV